MLFELSIIPLGGDSHLSDELAEVLTVIDDSGLPYQLGPGITCMAVPAAPILQNSISVKPFVDSTGL